MILLHTVDPSMSIWFSILSSAGGCRGTWNRWSLFIKSLHRPCRTVVPCISLTDHYAAAGHQSLVYSCFPVLPGSLTYRYCGCNSRPGSFTVRFRLYAQARLVVHSSLQCCGPACTWCLCYYFSFVLVDLALSRYFVQPFVEPLVLI